MTLISLTSPSDSDTMMGVFERNRFVKESLKVTPECKMGEKHVYLSPVGWDRMNKWMNKSFLEEGNAALPYQLPHRDTADVTDVCV